MSSEPVPGTTPPKLYAVGQFARLAGLTPKALRHYDRISLLVPAVVEADSGYRWYTERQLPTARTISELRRIDVPISIIREVLSDRTDITLRRILLDQQHRLESRVTRISGDLHRIKHLLSEGLSMSHTTHTDAQPDEKALAIDLFNGVWTLLEQEDRTVADNDKMLHMAHASRYHWGQVGGPENRARGEWQISRVYATLRRPEPCLFHAQRVLDLCIEHDLTDWDRGFAYEALARAHAIAGNKQQAEKFVEQAKAEHIADPEDRALLLADLDTITI